MARKKLADKTVHVHFIMPQGLFDRLIQRAGKETSDRKVRTTPSDIIRYAVEEYLNMYENATFVPDSEVNL